MEDVFEAERKQNEALLARYARLAVAQPAITGPPLSTLGHDDHSASPHFYNATKAAEAFPASFDMGPIHPAPLPAFLFTSCAVLHVHV